MRSKTKNLPSGGKPVLGERKRANERGQDECPGMTNRLGEMATSSRKVEASASDRVKPKRT